MTLALLLTAVTGAWADETPLVTITIDSNGNPVYSAEGLVTLTGTNYTFDDINGKYFWFPTTPSVTMSATVAAAADNVSITKVVFWSTDIANNGVYNNPLEDTAAPYLCYANASVSKGGKSLSDDFATKVDDINISKIEVYGTAETIEVIPVAEPAANTKQWTFTQPGGDVVLTPIYAPTAAWATTGTGSEVTLLAPAAAEGVIAGTDAPLIAEGTGIVAFAGTSTEVKQGTLMYAIGTSATEAPALTAFSATVPTAKDIADDGATLYVWYYIQGADAPQGEAATLDNTFNDSEVSSLTVTVLSNKFDLTLKAANANTIDATQASKGTVTVKVGDATAEDKTEDITDGKLKAVKMGSEVKLNTKAGYKFRKVEVKKTVVAEGHALTSAKFGEIVCSDGKAYAAADKENLPKGVKAEALVCYANGEHGLALAMADVKNAKMSWDNDRGANDGKTAAEWCDGWNTSHPIAGATWQLASKAQWDNMINAAGSASNLSSAFSAVGGTNLQAFSYWSSTPNQGVSAWRYYFPTSSWSWTYLNADNTGSYIRACLEW